MGLLHWKAQRWILQRLASVARLFYGKSDVSLVQRYSAVTSKLSGLVLPSELATESLQVSLLWTENSYENTIVFFIDKEMLAVREVSQAVLLPCVGCLTASRFLSKSRLILVIWSICLSRGWELSVYAEEKLNLCTLALFFSYVSSMIKGNGWN